MGGGVLANIARRGLHNARLTRLRARLRAGDPDLTAEELQLTIDRAEEKKRQLDSQRPTARESARIRSFLPRAAELYRKQIRLGLDGDARAAMRARHILKDLLGPITLEPGKAKGELWASYRLSPAALVKGATGTHDRGDRI